MDTIASSDIDPQPRVSALDGLRGWAAVIVVICHAFTAALIWYWPPVIRWPTWSARWFLVDTPLHIIWAGQEMVVIFFVLSGYVLTLPAWRLGRSWFRLSYYPRRLVRLYPAAWVAIGFAVILHHFPQHTGQPGASAWLNAFAIPVTAGNGWRTAILVGPAASSYAFTPVLWSMRWEVIFSLLLPAVVLLVPATRRRPLVGLASAIACGALIVLFPVTGDFPRAAAHYLPVFVLGSLMAIRFPPSRAAGAMRRLGRFSAPAGLALAIAALALVTLGYWTVHMDANSATGWPALGIVAGACLTVWLALALPLATRLLAGALSQWLGRRSYSLYLVHFPIVISLAMAFHGHVDFIVLAAMSLALSLIAAELMYRVVEAPSIQLSRRIAQRIDARLTATASPAGAGSAGDLTRSVPRA